MAGSASGAPLGSQTGLESVLTYRPASKWNFANGARAQSPPWARGKSPTLGTRERKDEEDGWVWRAPGRGFVRSTLCSWSSFCDGEARRRCRTSVWGGVRCPDAEEGRSAAGERG